MGLWPPFFASGIKVKLSGPNENEFEVSMPLRFYNKNYVGSHYGGSLYSMCDPFYMLILMDKLGGEYLVWDKAANIIFKKPGKGLVKAHFQIADSKVEEIIKTVASEGKFEPVFEVEVKDQHGDTVALVEKTLWVKKKDAIK
jgi:hypothetical protein